MVKVIKRPRPGAICSGQYSYGDHWSPKLPLEPPAILESEQEVPVGVSIKNWHWWYFDFDIDGHFDFSRN